MQRYSFDVDDNILFTLGQAAVPQIRFPINQPPNAVLPSVPMAAADERMLDIVNTPSEWEREQRLYEKNSVVEASKIYPISSTHSRGRRIARKVFSDFIGNTLGALIVMIPFWFFNQPTPQDEFVSAARWRNLATIQEMAAHGANINALDRYGWRALGVATANDDEELARYLLAHGADPNRADGVGRTPIMLAAEFHSRMIPILTASHANINAVDVNQATPLAFAAFSDNRRSADALLADGADPNSAEYDGWTPLMEAAKVDARSVAGALLAHGALINARNRRGETAADVAARYQHPALAKMLRHAENAADSKSSAQ